MMSSLSRLLSIPLIIVIILYFAVWQYQSATIDNWTLLPAFGVLTLLYVFNKEIDRWWWKKKPPPLDQQMGAWLTTHSEFLSSLGEADRQRFIDRVATFMMVKDFTVKAEKDYHLEEEFKAIIAHEFVRLTFYQDDYLYDRFEHFVIYNHAFATPDYQELHSIEVNREDGVTILSRLELVDGYDSAKPHFNIAMYAAILCHIAIHPRQPWPNVDLSTEELITRLLGVEPSYLSAVLGASATPTRTALLLYAYMQHPERLLAVSAQAHSTIQGIIRA